MLKLNNKGFAISGILYATLILFLILMLGTLSTLASGKFLLDKTKNDLIDKLNGNESIEIIMDYTKVTVTKGTEYVLNPLDGISAYNSAGEKIEIIDYSVYPEFDINTTGVYQITYTVTVGNTTEKAVRRIIVE